MSSFDFFEDSTFAIRSVRFVSLSVNEVTSVNNIQWLTIHVYFVQDIIRAPLLLQMSNANQNVLVDTLTQALMEFLKKKLLPKW
jgi:hypothetical protein